MMTIITIKYSNNNKINNDNNNSKNKDIHNDNSKSKQQKSKLN